MINRTADGRSIRLVDPAGEITEWKLKYADLSDVEAGALLEFFLATEGTLQEFVFVDPTANLLDWSAKLDEAVWLKAPLLTVSGGPEEWLLSNGGAGWQGISQTIEAPAGRVYCFSYYARSADGAGLRTLAGSESREDAATAEWRRIRLMATVEDPTFAIEVAAGGRVEVRGLQVESQAGASAARATSRGGVYEGARLRDDGIEIVATGINRNSCTVNIVHAIHI